MILSEHTTTVQVVCSFLLYRKVRKLEKIVYNEWEIKNDMAKERRGELRHDVVYVFFVSVQWDCTI